MTRSRPDSRTDVSTVDELLTVAQAGDYLRTGERFVRRLVAERRISYVKLGTYVRLQRSTLDAFIEAGRVPVISQDDIACAGLPPCSPRLPPLSGGVPLPRRDSGQERVKKTPHDGEGLECLSVSRIHVALTLDRFLAIGHDPIVGRWPSLLVFTSTASFRLDPAHTPQQRRGRRHLQSAVDEDRELAFRGSTPGEPSRRESDKPMNTRWSALETSVACRSRQASDRPVRTPSDAPRQTRSETRT